MKFKIKDTYIQCTDPTLVVSDNKYLVEFEFDEAWDGLTKTARFIQSGYEQDILLVDDACAIDRLKKGSLAVGVFSAGKATIKAVFKVRASILDGKLVADPLPSVYEQIIELIDAGKIKGDKGDKGDRGEAGYTPVKGVDYFDGAKGDKGDKGEDYVITEADYEAIGEKVEAEYTPELTNIKNDLQSVSDGVFFVSQKETKIGSLVVFENTHSIHCDISGIDGTIVKAHGKNLIDVYSAVRGSMDGSGNIEYGDSKTTLITDYIPVTKKDGKLLLTASWSESLNAALRIGFYNADKSWLFRQTTIDEDIVNGYRTFSTEDNVAFIRVCWEDWVGSTNRYFHDLQIEYGDVQTKYADYVDYTVTLPTDKAHTFNGSSSFYSDDGSIISVTVAREFESGGSTGYVDVRGDADSHTMQIGVDQEGALNSASNIAIGWGNLKHNSGTKNIALGYENMAEASGSENVSVGYHSQFRTLSGRSNTSVGAESCDDNTSGNFNTAIGSHSLQRNSKGESNVAIGYQSLRGGYSVFNENAKYDYNVAVGFDALMYIESGYSSVAIGADACRNQTKAVQSVAVGSGAGKSITTGNNNICIGCNADVNEGAIRNAIVIGEGIKATKSNQIVIGKTNAEEVIIGGKIITFNADGTVTWV